jgi:hypothetical protein
MKSVKMQFNGGELSPWLEGRADIAKYDKTAKLCRNFIPLAEGSLKRRGGTRFAAFTPEEEKILFQIQVTPEDAEVKINNTLTKALYVSRGDTVSYLAVKDGYVSVSGTMIINEETVLDLKLVSLSEKVRLTVIPTPDDAEVFLNGEAVHTALFALNEEVRYSVCKDGYQSQSGVLFLTEDQVLKITLEKEEEKNANFGDWGEPLGFVACTAVGRVDESLKCFCLRFTNGYLPVLFSSALTAPSGTISALDETLFTASLREGYDAVCYKNSRYVLSKISRENDTICYRDLDGNLVGGFTSLEFIVCGWQLDEQGRYATVYDSYSGVADTTGFKVYKNASLVWELKGRKNV